MNIAHLILNPANKYEFYQLTFISIGSNMINHDLRHSHDEYLGLIVELKEVPTKHNNTNGWLVGRKS